MSLKIDSEFKNLIPPLTTEEYQQLEENIIHDGCLHELIAWDKEGIIIDGHNRHDICRKNNISFKVKYLSFDSREDAKIWIIKNQFGRRNLPIEVRVKLAFKLEDEIKAKAMERMLSGKKADPNQPVVQGSTDAELGKMAGVSRETIREARIIKKEGTEEQKKKFESGEKKIKTIYKEIRSPKKSKEEQPQQSPQELCKDATVDFSFLVEESLDTEEDMEFQKLLGDTIAEAEIMTQFKNALCVPVVSEFLSKSLKKKLSQYPDTIENANNEDRKAFVNVFNIFKRIVRKGECK